MWLFAVNRCCWSSAPTMGRGPRSPESLTRARIRRTAPAEVLEETGVRAIPRRLVWVHVSRPIVHVNGDHAQYLDHVFRMDWVAGSPFPADDENDAAQWFDITAMPEMTADMRRRIELAVDIGSAETVFEVTEPSG